MYVCVCVYVCVGQTVANDGKVEMFVPAYSEDKMYVYRFENTQRRGRYWIESVCV